MISDSWVDDIMLLLLEFDTVVLVCIVKSDAWVDEITTCFDLILDWVLKCVYNILDMYININITIKNTNISKTYKNTKKIDAIMS